MNQSAAAQMLHDLANYFAEVPEAKPHIDALQALLSVPTKNDPPAGGGGVP
jgi:hypothetical protein